MRLESSRYPPVCGRSLNYRPHLPVQLQGELHAPRIVQDVAVTRQAAKVVVLQSLRARAEPYPVEDVESFPAEIKPELLVQGERLSHRDVLVVAGKVAQLRIVTGHVGVRTGYGQNWYIEQRLARQARASPEVSTKRSSRGPNMLFAGCGFGRLARY